MSFRATALKRRHLVAILLGLIALPVFAQEQKPPFEFARDGAVTTSFVKAPSNGGSQSSSSSSDDSQWLKVEFHYIVTAPPPGPTSPKYMPEIQFKVWIEGRDLLDPQSKPGEGFAIALTGEVTYINVPGKSGGMDNYGVVFVHPSTIGRYSGVRGNSDFEHNFDVHVEATIAGKLAGVADKNHEQDPNWYQALKPVPGLVYIQPQSPFLNYDTDRYPAIKPPPQPAAQ